MKKQENSTRKKPRTLERRRKIKQERKRKHRKQGGKKHQQVVTNGNPKPARAQFTDESCSLSTSATGLARLEGGNTGPWQEGHWYPAGAVWSGSRDAKLFRHAQWKTSTGRQKDKRGWYFPLAKLTRFCCFGFIKIQRHKKSSSHHSRSVWLCRVWSADYCTEHSLSCNRCPEATADKTGRCTEEQQTEAQDVNTNVK